MSTHNMCFHGDIRKILCRYPLLSGGVKELYDRFEFLALLVFNTYHAMARFSR